MGKENIGSMLEITLDKLKEVLGSETIVGQPIELPGGIQAIPISHLSFGFGSGGSDIPSKTVGGMFGGGIGGGASVTPIAFLISSPDGVRLLQLSSANTTADNLINSVPELLDKLTALLSKKENSPKSSEYTE